MAQQPNVIPFAIHYDPLNEANPISLIVPHELNILRAPPPVIEAERVPRSVVWAEGIEELSYFFLGVTLATLQIILAVVPPAEGKDQPIVVKEIATVCFFFSHLVAKMLKNHFNRQVAEPIKPLILIPLWFSSFSFGAAILFKVLHQMVPIVYNELIESLSKQKKT